MGLFKHKHIPFFLKKVLAYIVYAFTALTACFFAFALVVNFLGRSFSEEQGNPEPQKKEMSFKDVFKDIFKNLKTVLSELAPEDEDSNKQETGQIVESKEVLSEPEPNNQEPVPAPPEGVVQDQAPASPEGVVQEPVPAPSEGVAQNPVPPSPEGVAQNPTPPSPEGVVQNPTPPSPEVVVQDPVPPSPGAVVQDPVPPSPGAVVQDPVPPPSPEGIAQSDSFKNKPLSEASLEVQSYMAPFVYDSVNQKDPFEDPTRPVLDASEESGEGAIMFVPRTPPEVYNLDEINLKGIIWNNKTPKALFELPNSGGYYSLIKGDKIGNNGVLFEIRESEVVVVETNIIGKGKNRREERVIKIKKIDRINNK